VNRTSRLVGLLDYHVECRASRALGWGPDAFHPDPIDHPMAMALYMSGLAHLYVATGEARYADLAGAVADRLIVAGLPQAEAGLAWGLGFPWRHFEADEPFAITTAVAVRALAEVQMVVGHRGAQGAVLRASRWLQRGLPWRVTAAGAAPWYSPNGPYALPNVAAMVATALSRAAVATGEADPPSAAAATRFVVSRQDTETGLWCYGYGGVRRLGRIRPANVVDALHTAYTLDGLLSAAPEPGDAASARRGIGFLARELVDRSGRLRERVVVASRDDHDAERLVRAGQVEARSAGSGSMLLVYPQESRVAGYGAVIGLLARARSSGISDAHWLLDRVVARVLRIHAADISGGFRYLADDPRTFPRQEAHLFEGLAAHVRDLSRARTLAHATDEQEHG